MAIPYCEAGETAVGRLERAGDKWGLRPFRDKTMKGKKTRRNEAGNADERPPSPAGAGVPGWCLEGSASPQGPDLANFPPCAQILSRKSLSGYTACSACSCGAFNSLDSARGDCSWQTRVFTLHFPTRPCRRGPSGATSPWTLKLCCIPSCREEIRHFGDPGPHGGERFGEMSCWLEQDACSSKWSANGICAGDTSPGGWALLALLASTASSPTAEAIGMQLPGPRLTQSSWRDVAKS